LRVTNSLCHDPCPSSTPLSRAAKWTFVVLAVELVSWDAYFPAPYGLETRPISNISPVFGIPFYLAFALNIAAIPILWWRPRMGSPLVLLLGIVFLLGIPLDQAGLVVPGLTPPPAVTAFQVEGAVLSVLLLLLGTALIRERSPSSPVPRPDA
jgi:hypothetical protein